MSSAENKCFVPPESEILNQESEAVPLIVGQEISDEIFEIIDDMLKCAGAQQEDETKPYLVGLAAPQIGKLKRIILVDVGAGGKGSSSKQLRVFINPEIIPTSGEEEEYYEGCYSTGNVYGIVPRAKSIKVHAYSIKIEDGKIVDRHVTEIVEEYSGFVARIFQHEIDHLDGIRFPDRIDPNELDKKLFFVRPDQMPKFRANWETWPISGAEEWERVKGRGSIGE